MAFDRRGDLIVATMGGRKVYRVRRDGQAEVLLDRIDGAPLGAVNFCFCDDLGRLWISVFSRHDPWWSGLVDDAADG